MKWHAVAPRSAVAPTGHSFCVIEPKCPSRATTKRGPAFATDFGRARKHRRAFTLVEILIVVIILGVLAAIVVPQFSSASQDSRNSALKSQLQTVRSAIEVYQMQHMDQLPDLSTNWTPLMTQTNPQGGTTGTVLVGPYLPIVPVNALTGGSSLSTAAAAGVDWLWNPAAGTLTALDLQGNAFIETP
jgi:general secretion pathway protein G